MAELDDQRIAVLDTGIALVPQGAVLEKDDDSPARRQELDGGIYRHALRAKTKSIVCIADANLRALQAS